MPMRIEQDRLRRIQHCLRCRLTLPIVPIETDTCRRRHNPRVSVDLPDAVAALVCDVDVVIAVHRNTGRVMKTNIRSRLPVVIEYAHVHAVHVARRVQPPMIVAEIDANGISGEHDQILGN